MLKSLQVGRAFAALAVLSYHVAVAFRLPKYFGVEPFGPIFLPGYSGAYFFFVLSGYIIFQAHWQDLGVPARIIAYLWSRATRIYPMYWIATLATLVGTLFVPSAREAFNAQPAYLFGAVTLLPFVEDKAVLPVAWTLFHEMLFYLIFSSLLVSKRLGVLLIGFWGFGCCISAVYQNIDGPLGVIFSPINLLFFVGGASFLVLKRKKISKPLIIFALGAALFIAAWSYIAFYPSEAYAGLPNATLGIASGMIVAGAVGYETTMGMSAPRFVLFLGAASYSIYLTHFFLISIFCKIFTQFASQLPASISFSLITLFSIGIGCTIYSLVERPIHQFFKARVHRARELELLPVRK
ncbi:acyltransferase family protein [Bradyrhizobium vignae]|uniref:acyltransferase family protein n=1 Tax=Bradyrhizobium vignae TaxID=1549949 RepID=UPI00100A921E|nr:acyltransferase [Bradyrhizobium vignae]RXG85988.1 acyltransferase [Bradyrhizobium vignae]